MIRLIVTLIEKDDGVEVTLCVRTDPNISGSALELAAAQKMNEAFERVENSL